MMTEVLAVRTNGTGLKWRGNFACTVTNTYNVTQDAQPS